ncbi:MAG TPA: phospholipid ABC transporter ATP-binding protein MlaF [Gammaproteobacteria bacterium]|nr:phospholipid ABC transporter ATP-binding protein MlaF [Gammaproteobacteria bacterium]
MSTGVGTENSNLVELRDVTFQYNTRTILSDLSLTIQRGKVTAIMGGSGCGKTSLLNLIGGRLRPVRGQVLVDGLNVPDLNMKDLYALRLRMGMLFQHGALLTDLSVFENVAFPIREHTRLPESLLRHVVLMKLQTVGLRGARDLMPWELSGGMARRVALARTIALEPMMILYDEPFTGLDPISMGVIAKLIRELNQVLGITSIVVSHDVAEASAISDYAYLLGDGRILGQGTPAELQQSGSPHVRQFMDGLPDGPVPYTYPARNYLDDLLEEHAS